MKGSEKQGVKLVALAEPVKVNATYVLVNKKEDKLAAEINEALKALRADGTLSKINIKWYKNDLMKLLKWRDGVLLAMTLKNN